MSHSAPAPPEWSPPDVEELNQLLPQYEIDAIIGRGGMGAVYKGRQVTLDRTVAIKLLPNTLADGDDEMNFVERFKLEARSMAGLNHPAIIAVFDFGQTSENHLYFVMEFIDGMDIDKYIEICGGKVLAEHTVAIVSHVLDALEYAHSRGIMHRDIKPANILINREGKVKIADFGLAKNTSPEESAAIRGLTQTNVTLGTPDYIAPECLDSTATPDARADLYSVGVMLYQLLTGKIPRGIFLLPSAVDPALDARYDSIITRAMAGDPNQRYGTAGEFRAQLDEVLSAPIARLSPQQTTGAVAVPAGKLNFTEPGLRRSVSMRKHAPQPASPSTKPTNWVLYSLIGSTISALTITWIFFSSNRATPPQTAIEPVAAAENHSVSTPQPPLSHNTAPVEPTLKPAPTIVTPTIPSSPEKTSWPTGPNYRSVGHFRAWSSIPNDPVFNLDRLSAIEDVKQVYLTVGGWIVLRENGEIAGNYGGVNDRRNIRRIASGWMNHFGLIDNDGKLEVSPRQNSGVNAQPSDLGPVRDAYLSGPYRAAILENGDYVNWGIGVDGIKKGKDEQSPPNPEWIVRPSLPTGRKAVAMAGTDFSTALLLDDGSVRAWHMNFGELVLPPEFGPEKIENLSVHRNALFVVTRPGGKGFSFAYKGENTSPQPFRTLLSVRQFLGANEVILMLPEDGNPAVEEPILKRFDGLKEMLSQVDTVDSDLISMHVVLGPNPVARLLWFDHPAPPASKVESPQLTKSEKTGEPSRPVVGTTSATAPMPNPAEVATAEKGTVGNTTPSPSTLQSHPEYVLRISNYQKARHQQLGELVGKYQNALTNDFSKATQSGNLDHVQAIQTAITRVNQLTQEIEGLPAQHDVKPLSTLPELGADTPEALQRLRGIFDGELLRIEKDLFFALTQSLEALQKNFVQKEELDIAKELQSSRESLNETFAATATATAAIAVSDPSPPPAANSTRMGGAPASGDSSTLKGASRAQPYMNRLGMKFVPVPGTEILMCIHETRRADYEAFAGKVTNISPEWRTAADRGHLVSTEPDHPVVMVSQPAALKFCEWLSEEETLRYRLPTDREWSFAIGIGDQEPENATPAALNHALAGVFPWGTDWPPKKNKLGNYSDQAYREMFPKTGSVPGYEDGFALIAPVMSFSPNTLGIHDLDGNVWEWCQDFFDATDGPTGLARGSFWSSNTQNQMLSSHRQIGRPTTQSPAGGFRCVIDLGEPGEEPVSREEIFTATPLPAPDAEGWISLFNGTDLEGWRPASAASWTVKDAEIWKLPGVPESLDRVIPPVAFELIGEFRASDQGNGGIIFPFVGEVDLMGSKARNGAGVQTGGILGHGKQRGEKSSPERNLISDNRWSAFRIRMTRTRLETWIDEKEAAALTIDRSRHRETTIVIQGLNNGGEVAYRGLKMRPL